MDKEAQQEIASYIGEGVHTGLRKWCESEESHKAWLAIRDMPNEEWGNIAGEIAKLVLDYLEELGYRKPLEGQPPLLSDDELMSQSYDGWEDFKAIAQAQREADIKHYETDTDTQGK